MNRLLLFLFIAPFLAFVPTQKNQNESLGLLTKITSDTIKGNFMQIVISYDQLNRVVSITQTSYQLNTLNKNGAKKFISYQLFNQVFTYQGNNLFPFSRKRTSHKYAVKNKKNQVSAYLLQYFQYKNGARIGDSLITTMVDKNYNDSPISNNNYLHDSKFEETANELNRKHRIAILDSQKRTSSIFTFIDHLEKDTNLTKADYEVYRYNNDVFGYYYKFYKYDEGINPLQRLNIAPYIGSELFDFQNDDFDIEVFPYDSNPLCMFDDYLGWSFANKNNPTLFVKHGNDGRTRNECRVTKTNELIYTYNAKKLPVSCKVAVKTLFRYVEKPTDYHEMSNRRFYFEYK
ncbi:MAG: hypothetical protein ACOVNO_09345 [Sediminibacterium sp.]